MYALYRTRKIWNCPSLLLKVGIHTGLCHTALLLVILTINQFVRALLLYFKVCWKTPNLFNGLIVRLDTSIRLKYLVAVSSVSC
jgi:hypothetical protein